MQMHCYAEFPKKHLDKLQRVLNTAARIVSLSPKRNHISPILKDLHWLPIEKRIQYKLLILTYRCLHNRAPIYLKELIVSYTPSRNLRSVDKLFLSTPNTKLKTFGDRAFSVSAPHLWNELPLEIRCLDSFDCFKGALKTYLFKSAYSC